MKKYIFSIIMALVLATPGLVALAIADDDKANRFEQRDSNKDGKVDMTEYLAPQKAKQEAAFKAADTNGDGALSKEEWKARNAARKAAKGNK